MDIQASQTTEPRLPGLTARAALVGVVLIVLGALWVQKVSLVSHTCQVSEGTPSVPALMGLLLLSGLVLLLRLRRGPIRQELLVIYAMLSVGISLSGDNVMRQLLPTLTSLRYFAGPENDYALFADQVPPWLAISDDEVARQFCEGSDGGVVPWAAWAKPLAVWGGVFVGYSLCLYCLLSIFRKPWADDEHLAFPLAQLALDLTPGGDKASQGAHTLVQPLFWLGFGLGALFNASNIAHAFSPQLPALGTGFDAGALFTQKPWTGIRPLFLAFRPEIAGLGYMVPVDILFSTWVFYMLLRFENFSAQLVGYSIPDFPFEWAQGHGAYIALAVMVFYTGRHHLKKVFDAAVLGAKADDSEEAVPYRWAFWGATLGLVAMVLLGTLAGVSLKVSLIYIGLSTIAALIYGRIRAQTGLPISYIVPRRDIYQAIYELWPSSGRFGSSALREESNFAVLTVLTRMTFPQSSSFQMESMRTADLGRVRRAHMLGGIALALVVGTLAAYWTHVGSAYEYGNNILDGGTTVGGWRTRQSLIQYERLQSRSMAATGVAVGPTVARVVGVGLALALLWLRARFLRFPLHPLGYAIAANYGYHTWFPIFVVWFAKSLVLRLGGARLYRQITPLFLGLAVGHMLIAGGVWGLVGTIDEDVGRRYLIWFA